MMLSMTGFGRAEKAFKTKTLTVEIKTLNGKSTDIRMKIPGNIKDKEMDLRKIILAHARRGKMEATIEFQSTGGEDEYGLNKALFLKYFNELKSLLPDHNGNIDYVQAILRIPNVIKTQTDEISAEDWAALQEVTNMALERLKEFRSNEGVAMQKDLKQNVSTILSALSATSPYEADRIVKLRERLNNKMDEFLSNQKVDQNRFEQEIIYYLEKLDINEERVRLQQHCDYFLEVLNGDRPEKGKKLGFISQEMGREINTLGAKAQHADIQQQVVIMKDNLEKIKEQVANIV